MKKAIFCLLAVFALFGCSSDDNGGANNQDDPIYINFKANGALYNMQPYTASSLKMVIGADQGINNSYKGISLQMPLDFTIGTHSITDSRSDDAYNASFTSGDITADAFTGTLVITSITADFIEGTFQFGAKDVDGRIYNITEGVFKADKL